MPPPADTFYDATLPAALGGGSFLLQGDELSLSGTITTGVFYPTAFGFDGTKTAASGSDVAALPQAQDENQLFSMKPVLGKYKGHMTRNTDQAVLDTIVTISLNNKGHDVIDLVLNDPGVCDIEITGGIHPTHTGAFSLALGGEGTDGALTGHITHTGRLVLNLGVPGESDSGGKPEEALDKKSRPMSITQSRRLRLDFRTFQPKLTRW